MKKSVKQQLSYILEFYMPIKIGIIVILIASSVPEVKKKSISPISLSFISITTYVPILYILMLYFAIKSEDDLTTKKLFPKIRKITKRRKEKNINIFIMDEINQKKINSFKFCDICKRPKPPRTQHCYICGCCYIKNQRHSQFFNRCIHIRNHKQYICFVFALFSYLGYIAILAFFFMGKLLIFYLVLIDLLFLISSFILEIILLLRNESFTEREAIDYYLKGNVKTSDVFQSNFEHLEPGIKNRKIINPYNISPTKNFLKVFGKNPILWFLPICTSEEDGLTFEENQKHAS